jgi:hypothetical protein
MNIKNIIFIVATLFALGNQTTANAGRYIGEPSGKQKVLNSIDAELLTLHKKIVALKKELTLAQKQTEKDWEALTTCHNKQKEEYKTLSFYQSYTVDCSSYEELFRENTNIHRGITKDGYNEANKPVRKANSNYSDAKMYYDRFQQTLERCNRHHDFTCLDELLEEIRAWNKNN